MLRGLNEKDSLHILQSWATAIKRGAIYGFGFSKKLFQGIPGHLRRMDSLPFRGIFDNNPQLAGLTIMGYRVQSPDDLLEAVAQGGKVVILAAAYEAISEQMQRMGLRENLDFASVDFFWPLLYFYKYEKIFCPGVSILKVTHRCTLRCEGCNSKSPELRRIENDTPLNAFIEDLRLFFAKVDYLHQLTILGGEAALYRPLPELLDFICKNYRHRITIINYDTNGTLIPDEAVIQLIREYEISFRISDYSDAGLTGYREKMGALLDRLKQRRINPVMIYDPWSKRDLDQEESKALMAGGEARLRDHYATCPSFCHSVKDGLFHLCYRSETDHLLDAAGASKAEATNLKALNPENEADRQALLMSLLGYHHKPYLQACLKCCGWGGRRQPPLVEIPRARQVDEG